MSLDPSAPIPRVRSPWGMHGDGSSARETVKYSFKIFFWACAESFPSHGFDRILAANAPLPPQLLTAISVCADRVLSSPCRQSAGKPGRSQMPISLDFLYANQAQLSVTQADELVRMKFSPSEDYWRDPVGTESEGPECGWGRVRRQSAILFPGSLSIRVWLASLSLGCNSWLTVKLGVPRSSSARGSSRLVPAARPRRRHSASRATSTRA